MSKKRSKPKARKKIEFLRFLKRAENPIGYNLLLDKMVPVFNDHIVLENGYYMSIQCGFHSYSTPKKNLKSLKVYSAFEVACFDNKNNWIIVRPKEWKEEWACRYDNVPMKAFDTLNGTQEGHINMGSCIMPYLAKEEVEHLYQYLKKQKRKFVIVEKHKPNKEEKYEEYNY